MKLYFFFLRASICVDDSLSVVCIPKTPIIFISSLKRIWVNPVLEPSNYVLSGVLSLLQEIYGTPKLMMNIYIPESGVDS